MKRIFLYGIGGAEKQYRVLKYYAMEEEFTSIWNIKYQADMLKIKNPSVEHVYVVDDRHGLYYDYKESIRKNSIESCAIFKDILEREGIKIF